MSATELDLPVLITAEQIRVREFVTTRRGYDPDQVRDYLEGLADQVDLMASMIRDARMEADAAMRADAEPRVDPYEQLARRVTGVIREADEAAERSRFEGRRDAERLMAEARADAERIRNDAQAAAESARRQAEHALADAREQADRTIAGLSTRRDALVDQLATMQERLLGVARDLEATIVAPEMAAAPDATATDEPEMHGTSTTDASRGGGSPLVPSNGAAPANGITSANPIASNGASAPHTDGEPIVDVRRADDAPRLPSAPLSIEELFADLGTERDDRWGGTETVHLDVPDIPPLDLDWGDARGDDDLI
jgi:DivIVA domain-containing protein